MLPIIRFKNHKHTHQIAIKFLNLYSPFLSFSQPKWEGRSEP